MLRREFSTEIHLLYQEKLHLLDGLTHFKTMLLYSYRTLQLLLHHKVQLLVMQILQCQWLGFLWVTQTVIYLLDVTLIMDKPVSLVALTVLEVSTSFQFLETLLLVTVQVLPMKLSTLLI